MTIEFQQTGGGGGGLVLTGTDAQLPPPFVTTVPPTSGPAVVFRFTLEANEALVLHRLQVERADGVEPTGVTFDVIDETNNTSLASTTTVARSSDPDAPLATSETGVTIAGRLDNATAGDRKLMLTPIMEVTT
jgi:hypothetical protein